MFICAFCNRSSKPREKMRLVVVETRDREYRGTHEDHRGTEIVKEEPQCPRCSGEIVEPLADLVPGEPTVTVVLDAKQVADLQRLGIISPGAVLADAAPAGA